VLVTQRHNPDNLRQQLEDLQIDSYFSAVLTPYPDTKQLSIQNYGFHPEDCMVGDTEEDILTARELSLSSVAVTWGLRSKEYLQKFNPTYLVDTVKGKARPNRRLTGRSYRKIVNL
jgi:phosphoglycolate phosphatase-like HAD superfamily hydrolase